jgi:hypothetical protein
LFRIELSAVVEDMVTRKGRIVTAQGPGRKPSLLILRQLAYLDRGWPVQIIIKDEYSAG